MFALFYFMTPFFNYLLPLLTLLVFTSTLSLSFCDTQKTALSTAEPNSSEPLIEVSSTAEPLSATFMDYLPYVLISIAASVAILSILFYISSYNSIEVDDCPSDYSSTGSETDVAAHIDEIYEHLLSITIDVTDVDFSVDHTPSNSSEIIAPVTSVLDTLIDVVSK